MKITLEKIDEQDLLRVDYLFNHLWRDDIQQTLYRAGDTEKDTEDRIDATFVAMGHFKKAINKYFEKKRKEENKESL